MGREGGSGRVTWVWSVRGAELASERQASGRANKGLFRTPGAADLTPGPMELGGAGAEAWLRLPGRGFPEQHRFPAPGRQWPPSSRGPGTCCPRGPCPSSAATGHRALSGHFPGDALASLSLRVFAWVCPLVKVGSFFVHF